MLLLRIQNRLKGTPGGWGYDRQKQPYLDFVFGDTGASPTIVGGSASSSRDDMASMLAVRIMLSGREGGFRDGVKLSLDDPLEGIEPERGGGGGRGADPGIGTTSASGAADIWLEVVESFLTASGELDLGGCGFCSSVSLGFLGTGRAAPPVVLGELWISTFRIMLSACLGNVSSGRSTGEMKQHSKEWRKQIRAWRTDTP